MSQRTRADLTTLVIYVILPCSILSSFLADISSDTLRQCLVILIAGTALQLLYMLLNSFIYRRIPERHRVILQYATICNNSGFMGLPVMEAVFGQTGLLYGAVVLIPIRVFMWTAGLAHFHKTTLRETLHRLAVHPCIWAVVLGALYVLLPFDIPLPLFLTKTLSALGSCTTPMTMIIVGSILSEVELRSLADLSAFYYSAIRLVLIPAAVYGVLSLIGVEAVTAGVVVLSSAMPAATVTAMLAGRYGCDSAYAAKVIFISTALSMFTLPVWALIIT